MRIIGGRFRGHRLSPAPRRGVRPSADPVREALFNVLGARVPGRPFIDVCAGTGAVGLEAWSRGAEPVVLVERRRECVELIRRNIERLAGSAPEATVPIVVAADVEKWLRPDRRRRVTGAEVVYLDPPWDERRASRWAARLLGQPGLLAPSGWLVLEHRKGAELEALPEPVWQRRYGDAVLSAWLPQSNPDEIGT